MVELKMKKTKNADVAMHLRAITYAVSVIHITIIRKQVSHLPGGIAET